jgi:ATP-dependent DNA ligase
MLSRTAPMLLGSGWSFELKWDGFRAIVSTEDGLAVRKPYFPLVCRPVLNRDMSVPLTFVIFDLLRRDGVDLTSSPYTERRKELGESSSTARLDDVRAFR